MRVRLSDVEALPGFIAHVVSQGFAASACGRDEVEILFPGEAAALEHAAELDLWRAANHGVAVVALPEVERL
jgi:hypothetical protein